MKACDVDADAYSLGNAYQLVASYHHRAPLSPHHSSHQMGLSLTIKVFLLLLPPLSVL